METPLPPDFREFLALLNSEGVEYLVVGGYAVCHYGFPRPTGDLDVWIATDLPNAQRVKAALVKFGFAHDPARAEDLTTPNRIFRMGVPPVRIEVLTAVSGVTFKDCFGRCSRVVWDGIPVNVIARSDLLINKRAAGRHKDLSDIERLSESESD